MQKEPEFYHASAAQLPVFPRKNGLSRAARLCLNPLPSGSKKNRRRTMKTSPLVLAISIALAACATQEPPKPAPPAPAPAPAPKPQAAPELKPVAKPEPKPEPKKPAVVNLSSRELFEFNNATLTTDAKTT